MGGEDGAIALMRVLLQPKSLFLKRVKYGVENKEVKKKPLGKKAEAQAEEEEKRRGQPKRKRKKLE